MKAIGLVGNIGAGKDAVSDYICSKYGYKNVSMGDIVRALLKKKGLPENRENLQALQKECTEKHGMEFFAKEVLKKIMLNKWQKVIISGIRRPEDAEVPKRAFGKDFVLLQVDAPAELRFARMKARNRPGDPKTLEEFLNQEKSEIELFRFAKTLSYVDYKVDNSGTLEELHKNIDKLLERLGFE